MKSPKRKILIGSTVLVLLFAVLFTTLPYLLAGPPTPLFSVRNMDEGVHEVRVEVFDTKVRSMFNKTYELGPKECISHPKSPAFLLPGSGKTVTFRVTLDGMHVGTCSTKVNPWNTVEVELYKKDLPIVFSEIVV